VTRQRLSVSLAPELTSHVGPDYAVTFPIPAGEIAPAPASLRSPGGGPLGLFLDVAHVFETRMYEYRLLAYDQAELLVHHWQPGPDFAGPDHPHVHVSAALRLRWDHRREDAVDLDANHLATGRLSLEAVVRLLITEFGVAPQRSDWRDTLDRTEAQFRRAVKKSS
jgi:hypothetical protein